MKRRRNYHRLNLDERTEIRKNSVTKLLKGIPVGEVAEEAGVTRQTVYNWFNAYKKHKDKGLEHRPRGPKCALTPRQLKQLENAINRKATREGFPDDRWTLSRITEFVEQKFGVEYAPRSLFHVLKRLDCPPLRKGAPRKPSPKQPRKRS